MTRKRPTIADVADAAGVSLGTVSNYLNGTANLRPATKQKIDEAVRRLAYRRSTIARSLSSANAPAMAQDRSSLPRLVVVGYVSVDYMCSIDVLPHRDDRATANHIEKALGGPAANVAVAAAGIGAGGAHALDVELATALGDDPDSDWAIAELEQKSVRAIPIRQPANNRLSRCIVIIEPNGSRTIINEPFELSEMDMAAHYDMGPVGRPSCLHIEGYHLDQMRGSIERFRSAGWKVTLHAAGLPRSARTEDGFVSMLGQLDLIFANDLIVREVFDIRESGGDLIGAVADRLARLERRGTFVLTLGAQGAVVFPGDGAAPLRVPALPVMPVDATGAGDTFAGVFLAYWLNGAGLHEAASYAAAAGSLTVTVEGAQGLTASHEDLVAALSPSHLQRVS
ncbi:carbohydrate kinase family protein [Pelagibacterium montanilacus]|uniref:carbohydrate kinase family protein n=1 Tax=Pelagibacterium montanilacus TaxID=2185280 RepID=UPI000F8CDFFF|nr:PfkB family carbohydrate kinase [Pelagibacterium montanilacus]